MEHMTVKEKMKGMNSKEKRQYIWEYFKFHILGTIILIAFVASYVHDVTSAKETVLNATIIGRYLDQDKLTALQDKATAELVKDPKNKKVITLDFLVSSDDPSDVQYSMNTQMKLQASVAAKEIDVMILDRKQFETYADQSAFMKLSSIPWISQLNIPNSDFIKYQPKNSDGKTEGNEDIYGINIENLSILKDLKYDPKDKVLCVLSNTKRLDKVETFLKWFFAQKSN